MTDSPQGGQEPDVMGGPEPGGDVMGAPEPGEGYDDVTGRQHGGSG